MTLVKWMLAILIILGMLLSALSYKILNDIQPIAEGEIRLAGLKSPVRIIRDIYAIPHIYAENDHDLLFAQGYVTAQDRLWQMDLSRRISTGRLSEIFGERTVEIDYFFRSLEIGQIAEKMYDNLDRENKKDLIAYASGANAYINSGKKTIESVILRYDIEPWRPIDSISIHLLSAFDLSINMDEEIFALKALRKLGDDTVKELFPAYPEGGNTIIDEVNKLNLDLNLPRGYKMAKERFGLFQAKGASNNWVIDGAKSKSGKPMLANDPHLRIQIPSVWHEVHINAPGINVVGATFPGSPYVLIGHNRSVAWGFTDAMADRIDLYIERINPEDPYEYWYQYNWERMRTKKVDIKVKDGGGFRTVAREIKYTKHGPVISSSDIEVEGVLSMKWTGNIVEDQSIKGLSILNRSRNVEEAKEGRKYARIYTLNMVYADVDGNIGYQLIGGIPVREKGTGILPDSLQGKFPVPGWSGQYEWKGFIPDGELPNLSNPLTHFIATANNKIIDDTFTYSISNTWAPPYRYERIVSLLEQKEKLSLQDFKQMQADVYSIPAQKFVNEIIEVETNDPGVKWAQKELNRWNYEVTAGSLPALLYEVIRSNLIRNTFEDELRELYPEFLYTLNFNYNMMDKIMDEPGSRWWDDISTAVEETRDQIVVKSIEDALREIRETMGVHRENWRWGQLHKYRFTHPLGRVRFLDKLFNPKPIPAPGDRDTINNSYFGFNRHYYSDGETYDATVIPSYRFIVDLSDIGNAVAMNSTGQWGNPLSKHYSNVIQSWADVEYHPLYFEESDIEKNKWKELRLSPE